MIFFFMLMFAQQSEYVTLEDLRWQNRLLFSFSNDSSASAVIKQRLEAERAAVEDRDILYFLFSPQGVITNSPIPLSPEDTAKLISMYSGQNVKLKIVLRGKDGGDKLEENKLDLKSIFRLIDSMPMRRSEIQERSKE